MASGPEAQWPQVEAVLNHFGKTFYMGATPGAGQTMKLVNNLLGAISGSLELLQMRLAAGAQPVAGVESLIEVAQRSAQRAASLTQRLLAFSRQQQLDPRPTDVDRLVRELDELIRRTVGPHIAVEVVCLDDAPWLTQIDGAQLESAVLNLAINARDAMAERGSGGGGRLRLETRNERIYEGREEEETGVPAGDYVTLRVVDTGSGMSPEVLSRACDPFFTTKPQGQGTGLGLSMIQGFVHQSGGHMSLQSEVGVGTTVCLRFPRSVGAVREKAAVAASVSPKPGVEEAVTRSSGQSILVIDDEPGIREVVALVLREEGYRVIEAADGDEGLDVLKSGVVIDLLITDVGLPGELNGRQVADAARNLRPNLKVLFSTGYAEQSLIGKEQLGEGMQVLRKPFPLERLVEKVRGLVAG